MKIYTFVLFWLLTILLAIAGEQIQVNKNGEVRVLLEDEGWRALNVEELDAYGHPGEKVRIFDEVYKEKAGFFHKIEVKTSSGGIIFNNENKKFESFTENVVIKGEPVFRMEIILFSCPMIIMAISNILFWKKENIFSATFIIVANLVAALASAFTIGANFVASFSFVIAIVAALTSIATANDIKTVHWSFSVVFYIFCLLQF